VVESLTVDFVQCSLGLFVLAFVQEPTSYSDQLELISFEMDSRDSGMMNSAPAMRTTQSRFRAMGIRHELVVRTDDLIQW
jgi:hypothetical protein